MNEPNNVNIESRPVQSPATSTGTSASQVPEPSEASGKKRGPCIYPGCTDDAKAIYAVCYKHRNQPHWDREEQECGVPSPSRASGAGKAADCEKEHPMEPAWMMLLQAAQEVWTSVPGSYDADDPMVKRHATALNALGDVLASFLAAAPEKE